MPIYSIQGPDGRVYEIEGPPGATKAQVVAAIQAKMRAPEPASEPVAQPQIEPQKREGFGAALGKGIEGILSPSRTAFGALTGSAEEAALAGIKRAEESPYAEQVSLEKVKEAYQRGLLPAAGEVLRQIPLAVTEQLPNIAATLGSARLGAMAGAPLGPYGAIGGGILGAVAPSLLQQFGGNIQRQAQEQLEAKQPVDISRTAAAAAAGPQAALDVAATFIPLGRTVAGSVLGPQVKQLLEKGAKESAEKLARESLPTVLAKGAGISIATEAPTEAIQSMLERAQAGIPLLSEDALKEYGEAAYQAALIAPIGSAARVGERSAARQQPLAEGMLPGETERQAAERLQAEILSMKQAAQPPAPGPILNTNNLYNLIAQPNGYGLVEQYKQRLMALPEQTPEVKQAIEDASFIQRRSVIEAAERRTTKPAPEETVQPKGQDAGETVTPPSGESVQVAGEPGAGAPAAGVGVAKPTGMVRPVEDVAKPDGRKAAAPAAVAPKVEALQGSETRLILPDGEQRPANWEVIEADSVSASMIEGRAQPRDRQRAASNAQVQSIANNPDFDRLSDTSQTMDYGAPTLTSDYVIVGGNGRFEGVNLSYNTEAGQAYKQNLISNAQRFGLDPAQVSGMKKPVLIRKIPSEAVKPEDTRKLAIQSNIVAGLEMSDMERAALDSERMTNLQELDITDTGDIPLTTKNMGTIRDALRGYTKEELSGMLAADGSLSQSGLRRVKNAVLYKAYGKTDTLSRLLESPDADLKNVGTALMRASGSMSRLMDGIRSGAIPADYDIIADLTGAVETLSALRASGTKIQDFISQSDMFGGGISNEAKTILTFLDQNLRSAKSITEFLNDYANAAISAESAGDGLFGEVQLPSKQETIERAAQRQEAERAAAKAQQTIFEQPAGAPATESGAKPEGEGRPPESGEGAVAKKSLVEMRKRYEAARAAPAPVETKPEPTELDKEIQAKIEELGRVLSRIMGRFGLKDVALNLVENMKAEGEYAQSVIRLALDAVSPVQALRHESIHALKELGFFTPQQWAALEKQAKSKWIDQYLKNVNINKEPLGEGEKSRYDAYMDLYKGDMDAIIEEAIADAFGDFDVNKAPPGLMQAILTRLRNFFDAVKTAFGGEITAEQVFRKVERGELKTGTVPQVNGQFERLSLSLPDDYRGEHKAPTKDSGSPAHDLSGVYPDDVYGPRGPQYYAHYADSRDLESFEIIRRVRNLPNVPITVYRAVPKSAPSVINNGDWVTISKKYAKEHGEGPLKGDYKIVNKLVHPRDIFTNGDSIHEWGYDPQPIIARQEAVRKGYKPSLRVMRGEEVPNLGKKVTVDMVGKYFDEQIIKEFGGKLDYNNPEHFDRAVKQAAEEVQYQIKNDKSGLDWYEEDIQKAFKDTAKILPELKKKENRILFSVMAGIMSPQTIARDNWFIAAKAFEHYVKTGDIPGVNPENGNLWMGGTQSANKKVQLEFLDKMVKDLGQKNAIKWMMTPHPVSEINEFRSKYGNIKSGIDGKATDIKPGLYAFGPKIGPFVSNINGIHDVTVDKWFTRTFNRYFGTMIGPDGKIVDAPTEPQRRFIKELANKVAEDAGIKNYQVQSLLWFYEQRLFTELGAQSPSYGFSDGAVKFLESRGKGGGAGVAVPAGPTGAGRVKPSLRAPQTEAFTNWFGNSKVVDNNGDPLVVYHGTSYDITEFDTRADMRRGVFRSNELGSWFSENPTVANAFATGIRFPRKDGNVMPVYLSIKNPLTVYTYRDLERMAKGRRSAAAMRRDLEKEGYDGILIVNSTTDTGTVRQDWVAFRPEQIKSAIGNVGTYSPTTADIRYSLRAPTTAAFKRWFGDSKIVNPDGTPKVMYHGTGKDYTVIGTGRRQAKAIFVTDDPEFAQKFAIDTYNRAAAEAAKGVGVSDKVYQRGVNKAIAQVKKDYKNLPEGRAMIEGIRKGYAQASPEAQEYMRNAFKDELPAGPNILPIYVKAERPFDYDNKDHVNQVVSLMNQDFDSYGRKLGDKEANDISRGDWETIEKDRVQKAIRDLGFDGFYVKEGGRKSLAVYKSEQVKSATGNIGTFDITNPDIRYSLRDSLGLYRELETKIAQGPNKAPAASWKAYINGLTQKGVKPEEIEWSGVKDWLDLQKGTVTKEELLNYLKQGGVKVEETVLGGPMPELQGRQRLAYEYEQAIDRARDADVSVNPTYIERLPAEQRAPEEQALLDAWNRVNENPEENSLYDRPLETKYGQYTLPGGENYREVLLTLPSDVDAKTQRLLNEERYLVLSPEDQAKVDAAKKKAGVQYRSPHWDQPNVIAHIRINDRTDADGNKVLFVEEIQSDWGQEGKKKGFKGEPTYMKGMEGRDEGFLGLNDSGVPRAPFISKTEGWLNLALKRIMVMAAEGGYDKVAFVNGEQSADRYDLSKQIDGVGYTKNDGGTIDITVYRNRSTVMDKTMQTPAEVEDLIGKELTRKIVDSPERIGALEGLNLKVGGEGMKTFYDQIVPLAVKKLLPKVGGGQIGIVEFRTSEPRRPGKPAPKRMEQPGFDVTPDMKRKVETTGLPRFSLRDVSGRAAQPESKAAPEIQQGVEVQKLPYMGDDVELPSYSRLPISGKTTPRRPTLDQIESGRYSLRSQLPTSVVKAIDRTTVPRDQATFGERITKAFSPDAFSWFRSQALNRYNRLSEYDRELARQLGGTKLLADVSAESAALFSDLGAGLTAEIFGANDRIGGIPVYKNGFTKVDNRNKTIKGPLAIFAPLLELSNGDPYIFQAYQFWAGQKRGMRLDAQGKLTPFTQADIAEAKALERRYPQFKSVQAEWIKFNDGLVDFLVDTGVISAQNAAEFKRYSDYLPFYKQVLGEATQGPKIFQAIAGVRAPKQLKGGEGQLDDFLETIVRNVQASVQSGIKNVAGQRAAKVATSINMAENITAKINNATALRSQLLASGVPSTDQRILQLNDDIQNARQQMSGPLTFTVLENGLTVHYRSSDPLFMDAIKSLNLPDLPFIGLLSGPSNILRNLITKEPTFMLANMLRDSTSAWVTSGSKMTPIVDTIRNFGSALAGQNPNVEALYRAGILGGYDYASTLEASGKAFGKELRKVSKKLTPGERFAKPFTSLWDALEKGTQASDAATRAEIYKRTLEETKSSKYPNGNEAEALFRALEIMNFNRRGRSPVIRILTAAVPFLNARMQGLDVLYRTAIQPSFDKTATSEAKALQKTFFVRGMTILALSSMYWALTHDDDDYKKQEQETRDNYWLVPSLGIKIPIPFEVGVIFKVIPERIMEYAFGSDTGKDFMDSMTRQFLNTFAFNLIPQAGLPIYEVKTNHSFFTQRPIIGQGMENVADKYQVGPTTSKISQFIGEQVGLSPIKLDHLIKGYTGTLGMYAVDVMDAIMDMNSDSPKAAKRFEQMPIIKRFALDPEARGAVTNYYQLKNSVDEVVRTSNFLERSMRFEEYGEYMRDNMNMFVMRDYVNDLEKSMAEFREMKNLIRSSQIGADEKRDRLTQLGQVENMLTMKIQELKKQMSQR